MIFNNIEVEIPKVIFGENGNLEIVALPTSSKNDFDFYEGKWKLYNRKLKIKLDNCNEWVEFQSTQEMYRVLNGIGICILVNSIKN